MQFHVGQYVRDTTGTNSGTGQIQTSADIEYLHPADGKVHRKEEYLVRWLDCDGRMTPMIPADMAASARAVPKFSSPEDAEAWFESQAEGNNWIDKVDDDLATIGELPGKVALEAAQDVLVEEAVQDAIQTKIDAELKRLFGQE